MRIINQNFSLNLLEKAVNLGKKYKNPIESHLLTPNSRKLAINAKCFECCGGNNSDDNKGVKAEIRHCSIKECALYNFRPYKNKETANTLARVAVSNLSIQQTYEVHKNEIS
jgi:hypothetical protein